MGGEEVRRELGRDDRVAEVWHRCSVQSAGGLEENLGMPLPPATQWGIVKETAQLIRPAYEEWISQAAQISPPGTLEFGRPTPARAEDVLYNDETAMKILPRARTSSRTVEVEVDQKASDSHLRTGQFTSGIISTTSPAGRREEVKGLWFSLPVEAPALPVCKTTEPDQTRLLAVKCPRESSESLQASTITQQV
jgi:hypothetical protein